MEKREEAAGVASEAVRSAARLPSAAGSGHARPPDPDRSAQAQRALRPSLLRAALSPWQPRLHNGARGLGADRRGRAAAVLAETAAASERSRGVGSRSLVPVAGSGR